MTAGGASGAGRARAAGLRALFATTALVVGCGPGPLAGQIANAPTFELAGATKCSVHKSQDRPLIIEWPSADRAALEALIARGVVAVRYEGCEMELLAQCRAPGSYDYTPTTRKVDRVQIRDEDELYANVPVGAAKLEGTLARAGELNVSMSIVGRYAATQPSFRPDELEGLCGRATHTIAALTTGAFEFYAGAEAEVGGGAELLGVGSSAKSAAERTLLNKDGEPASCEAATTDDTRPPEGCRALLRVEVVPLGEAPAPTPAPAPAVATVPGGVAGALGGAVGAPGGATVLAPGPGVVRVHIASEEPMVQLFQWGTMVPAPDGGFAMTPGGTQLLCRAPCDRVVDARPGQQFFVAGELPTSDSFALYDREGDVTVEVDPGNGPLTTLGGVMAGTGVLALLVGVPLIVAGAVVDGADGVLLAGGVTSGGGGVLLAGGLALTYGFKTQIDITDGVTGR